MKCIFGTNNFTILANVDKLPEAGYGSTSNSCAIIRLHYSTPAGVAMARLAGLWLGA